MLKKTKRIRTVRGPEKAASEVRRVTRISPKGGDCGLIARKQVAGGTMGGQWRRRSSGERAEHIPTQLQELRGVLLLARSRESWMTLEELARKTKFPEASISAQLRHLRKEEYGSYLVEKRRRGWQEALRTNTMERVWEY
jgi:hypothetical protein